MCIRLAKAVMFSNLLISEAKLAEIDATFYKINRGGDITYHGPGQIVGYPIIDLENYFTDIHKYLRFLEEMVILTLAEYGLKADRSKGENRCLAGCGNAFCSKNMRYGSSCQQMGHHAWFRLKCEFQFRILRSYDSLWY